MKIKIIYILVLVGLFGCSKEKDLTIDVSKIKANVEIKRFEQDFYKAQPLDLPKIKKEYRYLFPHDVDSIWIKKMQDKDEQELFAETQKIYPNLKEEKKKIEKLFKHLKYYYPKFKEPKIVTVNSNVSFEQQVVYTDSLLFISLDVFLGRESKIYEDYPDYLKQNFSKKHLIVAVAEELVKPIVFRLKDRTFIARIIQQGKLLYALDAFLPKESEGNKIGYTKEQIKWVKANEKMIWKYFVEKKLLYDTDLKLNKRFIERAPFTKFYLEIDSESPGKVGAWLGWQIVQSYMKHNEIELKELMQIKNEEIFKKSKYKPRK